MKKLLSVLLVLACANNVKAQNMNFDETVKYINEKITTKNYGFLKQGWGNYNYIESFKATNSGEVSITIEDLGVFKWNLFDLKNDNGEVIEIDGYDDINFYLSTGNYYRILTPSETEAKRLVNAL